MIDMHPVGCRCRNFASVQKYPTTIWLDGHFNIDVKREQALLLEHDLIVLQHPLYWYSVPPLMKQWFDLVLEHGWAYGSQGNQLEGKTMLSVITAGGNEHAYCREGYNRHQIRDFLYPIEQTARL